MQTKRSILYLVPWLALLATSVSVAAETGEIHGRVLTANGDPAADVHVTLVELRREVHTDDEGSFVFSDLKADSYLLSALSPLFGGAVERVLLAAGDVVEVELHLDQRIHGEAISVTASGVARGLDEVVLPVEVLSGEDLLLRRGATLGETLEGQAGVAASSYGRGSSRPVIRGLGGDRVRILENGLDVGDVSSVGPDHAVSSDPATAESIEVLRGPGTLLYGSTAVGGVVNILDSRVPDRRAERPVAGTVEIAGGSVADELSGSLSIDGGAGALAWHVNFFARDVDDYDSPAPHRAGCEDDHHQHDGGGHGDEHDEENFETGRVPDTWARSAGGALGLSWVRDNGYIGVALSGLDAEYGIPGHHHHEEGEEPVAHDHENGGVHSELEQRRFDLHGQLDDPFPALHSLRVRMGWRDYEHSEIEGEALGTKFESELLETRLEAVHHPLGVFTGTFGLHWVDRDFAATGEEAFVMPTTTHRLAAFVYEETPAEPIGVQLGLRWERQDTESTDPGLPSRDFDGLSASAGLAWKITDFWLANLAVTRTERAPVAEELYSDGPHAATRAYEIGDPDLEMERGLGVDLAVKAEGERFAGGLSVFQTRFDDFIYLQSSGEEIHGLGVQYFVQDDAEYTGFEVFGDVEMWHSEPHHLNLELVYDQVRAQLQESGEPLPRIPPQRLRAALIYRGFKLRARLEGRWVSEQDRVAENEEPTDSFVMADASIGYRFFTSTLVHDLLLRGTNLLNEQAYNHVSFLKEETPFPGRNLSLVYRLMF